MRKAIYKNPEYCLSFGVDDVIFVDLEVEIVKTGESSFALEITKSQLNQKQMEFATYLVSMLSADGLHKLNEDLRASLVEELTPNLFSLFYSSEVQHDESQTQPSS